MQAAEHAHEEDRQLPLGARGGDRAGAPQPGDRGGAHAEHPGQVERAELQQARHEVDLVERRAEEEPAERHQGAVGEVAAAVEVALPARVGRGQRRQVGLLVAGQAAGHGPEPVAGHADARQVGVGEEPGHPPVAVEERVDPGEPVV